LCTCGLSALWSYSMLNMANQKFRKNTIVGLWPLILPRATTVYVEMKSL